MVEQGEGGSAADMQLAAELLPVVDAKLRRLAIVLSGGLPPAAAVRLMRIRKSSGAG
jgi:hypothetical protein